jgi:hypothetical protein
MSLVWRVHLVIVDSKKLQDTERFCEQASLCYTTPASQLLITWTLTDTGSPYPNSEISLSHRVVCSHCWKLCISLLLHCPADSLLNTGLFSVTYFQLRNWSVLVYLLLTHSFWDGNRGYHLLGINIFCIFLHHRFCNWIKVWNWTGWRSVTGSNEVPAVIVARWCTKKGKTRSKATKAKSQSYILLARPWAQGVKHVQQACQQWEQEAE